MRDDLDNLFTKGPEVILTTVYGEWAREHSFIKKREVFGTTMELPIPIEELNETQRTTWDTYRMVGSVQRDLALRITRQLIHMIPQPGIRHIPDESLRYLHGELGKARKKLVADIFPDLTDDEAKKLFGQLSSAKEVLGGE